MRALASLLHPADNGGDVNEPNVLSRSQLMALVVAVIGCRLLAVHSFPIYDDAFITYRYAQNLATGAGLVYNPGAPWEPVLGTTTPTYALLLAGLGWLGFDIVQVSLALNLVCDAGIALLLVALLGRRRIASTVAVGAFAAIPQLARISVGGMEPPLLVLLALLSVVLAREGRLGFAGLASAIACTVRPEAVLLVLVLAAMHVRSRSEALRFFAPVLAVGAAAALLLWQSYGHPIPQSVRAKAGSRTLRPVLRSMGETLAQAFGPSLPMRVLFPLALFGMARTFWTRSALRPFVAFACLVVGGYLFAGVKTWGWYFYPPLVAWTAGLGIGASWLYERLVAWRPRLALDPLRTDVASLVAVLAVASVALYTRLHPDRVTPEVYRPLAQWAEAARLGPRGVHIVASDIGALGYYSGARILDTEGLIWPEAHALGSQTEAIRATEPEYVVMVASRLRMRRFHQDPVAKEYRPILRFNTSGERELEPDVEALPIWWEQDYIVYERRREL